MGLGIRANVRFVHVEQCKTGDSRDFKRSYKRYYITVNQAYVYAR